MRNAPCTARRRGRLRPRTRRHASFAAAAASSTPRIGGRCVARARRPPSSRRPATGYVYASVRPVAVARDTPGPGADAGSWLLLNYTYLRELACRRGPIDRAGRGAGWWGTRTSDCRSRTTSLRIRELVRGRPEVQGRFGSTGSGVARGYVTYGRRRRAVGWTGHWRSTRGDYISKTLTRR